MKKKKDNSKILKLILLSIVSGFFTYYFLMNINIVKALNTKPIFSLDSNNNLIAGSTKIIFDVTYFIDARSYIVYDITDETTLIENNSKSRLPLASLTKLMTSYVALSDCNYKDIEKIKHMLVVSSNEDAVNIAEFCGGETNFVEKMNKTAIDLNLNMNFENPSGLDKDNETVATAFGDSISVAKLITILVKKYPNIMEATSHTYYEGSPNTNIFADSWPFLIGSKTGFTDVAGGNLSTVFTPSPDKMIAIVVLGSTKDGRFEAVSKLLNKYLEKVR